MTIENVTFVLVILLVVERILRFFATRTGSRIDAAVGKIDRARGWVREYAPLIFGIVEDLAETGRIPAAQKAHAFLARLETEWARIDGEASLPPQAVAEARLIADGLAAATPHAPKDPRVGPASS